MPIVSVSLSESAYEGYKSIARGKRSRVAAAAFLAHNHAQARFQYVAYENPEGDRVKISGAGKSVNEILQLMSDQAKCIDAMQRRIFEITGEEE